MASETLTQVAERMASDVTFRKSVVADSKKALAGYDLTDEERSSLLSDSPPDIGVDQRVTKGGMRFA